MNKILRSILLVFFSLVFLGSAVMLTKELVDRRISAGYLNEMQGDYTPASPADVLSRSEVEQPDTESSSALTEGTAGASTEVSVAADTSNPSIQALVADYPDAVGWLTCEGADVSHPFAIGEDNATYIRSTLDGSYVRSGTLFMDYRNDRSMEDSLSVIFGHNMNNGTMFSSLKRYLDSSYIVNHPDVYISLPDRTIHYTVWASMVANAVYDTLFTSVGTKGNIQDIVDYVSSNADYINRNLEVDGNDKLLVLSTCNPSYFYARTVLICVAD